MGTRGSIGFRLNEKDYLTYNHFDSYPEGLGAKVLADVRLTNVAELKKLAEKVKLVDEETTPTIEEIEALKPFMNMNVTENKDAEKPNWYQLMRELQGELLNTIRSGYMVDGANFIKDSLFCEWAYIINFDTNELEVYRGFQKVKADVKGRYKNTKPYIASEDTKYYACSLVKTYPLNSLPSEEVFLKDLKEPDEE